MPYFISRKTRPMGIRRSYYGKRRAFVRRYTRLNYGSAKRYTGIRAWGAYRRGRRMPYRRSPKMLRW